MPKALGQALIDAILRNDNAEVGDLLSRQADPHYDQDSPMHTAIINGRVQIAEQLLSAGVLLQDLPFCPFKAALLDAHVEMVRWLIAQGVVPDNDDYLILAEAIDYLKKHALAGR